MSKVADLTGLQDMVNIVKAGEVIKGWAEWLNILEKSDMRQLSATDDFFPSPWKKSLTFESQNNVGVMNGTVKKCGFIWFFSWSL